MQDCSRNFRIPTPTSSKIWRSGVPIIDFDLWRTRDTIAWAAPEPLVEARLSIFRAIREGRLATVTDTVERVLGRKPITFNQWVQENATVFADSVHPF
jgi:hypothetical protein